MVSSNKALLHAEQDGIGRALTLFLTIFLIHFGTLMKVIWWILK
jgi:hypothetical protein